MAKNTKERPGSEKDPGPQKGFVRLKRETISGGYIDLPKEDAERLLALEKSLGVKYYVTDESNDGTDSGSNQSSEE